MKFKKGDTVIRNKIKPNYNIGDLEKNKSYTIDKVITINNTEYYTLKHYYRNGIGVLFSKDFDDLFELDLIYNRIEKIKKIYEGIRTT